MPDASAKPSALPVIADNIPTRLKQADCWLVWRYTPEEGDDGAIDWDKPPLCARGLTAGSSTNKRTWSTFAAAWNAYQRHQLDGIGYALCPVAGDGPRIVGVDLDHCRDLATGEISDFARDIIARLNTYTEISPSGCGLRLFLLGRLPPAGRKKAQYENYETGRYVTVTGHHLDGTPTTIEERQEQLLAVHAQQWPPQTARPAGSHGAVPINLADAEIIERAKRMRSGKGEKFKRLWEGDASGYLKANGTPDYSAADLALCDYLAFWCGPDASRIDGLFRQSGLMRSKWNAMRGARTYAELTVTKALDGRTQFYVPRRRQSQPRANGTPDGADPDEPETAPLVDDGLPPLFANYRPEADPDNAGEWLKIGLSAWQMGRNLLALADNWPKRVGPRLFMQEDGFRPGWLETPDALFAWIGRRLGATPDNAIRWTKGEDKVSQAQFTAYLRQTAEGYDAIETAPHHPSIGHCYYMHPPATGGNGAALQGLLERFQPATPIDFDLIKSLFLTLFWGGPPGQRPAFLIDSEEDDARGGRGVGKSKLAMAAAHLAGGHIDARPQEDIDRLMTRLLSAAALDRRVVFLDNVKTLRFSWGDLEALITADVVSGRALYVGEGRRPNTLVWIITLNSASLSRDMAQRCVPIRIKRPPHDPAWEAETWALIDRDRWAIVGDLIAELRRDAPRLERYSRWSAWEQAVLSRVAEPSECQAVIAERQDSIDDDLAESAIVREAFVELLARHGYDPETSAVWIPSKIAAGLVIAATGSKQATNRANGFLRTLNIPELRRSDHMGHRGWAWRGANSDATSTLQRFSGEIDLSFGE